LFLIKFGIFKNEKTIITLCFSRFAMSCNQKKGGKLVVKTTQFSRKQFSKADSLVNEAVEYGGDLR
jgi:hypothetical protein